MKTRFFCAHCKRFPVWHDVETEEEAAQMPNRICPFCGETGFSEEPPESYQQMGGKRP